MRFLWVALCASVAGCALGFGAVNGPSREYDTAVLGGFYKDSGGNYVDTSGQRWSRSTIWAGWSQPDYGLALGVRRGWSWTSFGNRINGGDSIDYHASGFYGPAALAVGYTSDGGNVDIPYGTTTLKSSARYHGLYLEPAVTLFALGGFYVGAVCALIAGTTGLQLENRSTEIEGSASGIRPGIRVAVSLISFGPVTLQLSADVRYLFSSEVDLVMGGTKPMSYGGPSSAFAVGFIL